MGAETARRPEPPLEARLRGPAASLAGAALAGLDLRGFSLAGRELAGADLGGARLSGTSLAGACLAGARLDAADLQGADLRGASLRGASLRGTSLRQATLAAADLSGAYLEDCVLTGADLRGARCRAALLLDVDLREAQLAGADFNNALLHGLQVAPAALATVRHLPPPNRGAPASRELLRELGAILATLQLGEPDPPQLAALGERLDRLSDRAPSWSRVARAQGELWRRRGELHSACFWFEEAVRRSGGEDLYAGRSLAGCLRDLGQPEQSLAVLRRLHDAVPDDPGILRDLAYLHAQSGRLALARELLQQALAVAGESVELLVQLAEVEARDGAFTRSGELLQRALVQAPERVELLHHLAELCARALDLPAEAVSLLGRYLDARPDDAAAQLLLAEQLLHLEEHAAAQAQLARAAAAGLPAALRLPLELRLADLQGSWSAVAEATGDGAAGAGGPGGADAPSGLRLLRLRALVALGVHAAAAGLGVELVRAGTPDPVAAAELVCWQAVLAGSEPGLAAARTLDAQLPAPGQLQPLAVALRAVAVTGPRVQLRLPRPGAGWPPGVRLAGPGGVPAVASPASLLLTGGVPRPAFSPAQQLAARVQALLPALTRALTGQDDVTVWALRAPPQITPRGSLMLSLGPENGSWLLVELLGGPRQLAAAEQLNAVLHDEARPGLLVLPGARSGWRTLPAAGEAPPRGVVPLQPGPSPEAGAASLAALREAWRSCPPGTALPSLAARVAEVLDRPLALPDPLLRGWREVFLRVRGPQLRAARRHLGGPETALLGLTHAWREQVALPGQPPAPHLLPPGELFAGVPLLAAVEELLGDGLRPPPGLREGPLLVVEEPFGRWLAVAAGAALPPELHDALAGLLLLVEVDSRLRLLAETAALVGEELVFAERLELRRDARILEALARGQLAAAARGRRG
ncbi:MAG: pentapeptide repeat-containing protein [Myxococcota bacterium]|nr:pentapeptide repeat-containing protein [Myxococcota bacterium]